ncbi:MAG: hypothetical protein ACI8W8_000929 [Rhodothermales bacterium]
MLTNFCPHALAIDPNVRLSGAGEVAEFAVWRASVIVAIGNVFAWRTCRFLAAGVLLTAGGIGVCMFGAKAMQAELAEDSARAIGSGVTASVVGIAALLRGLWLIRQRQRLVKLLHLCQSAVACMEAARLRAPKPAGISFRAGAAVVIAYFTVWAPFVGIVTTGAAVIAVRKSSPVWQWAARVAFVLNLILHILLAISLLSDGT